MGKQLVDGGAAVVEILETNAFGNVSRASLEAWINTYKIPVTTVRDPDNMQKTSFNALGVRETVFIVDLRTMKIVDVINGSVAGAGDSAVKQAIKKILAFPPDPKGC